jgi:molecular chaperone GrpE
MSDQPTDPRPDTDDSGDGRLEPRSEEEAQAEFEADANTNTNAAAAGSDRESDPLAALEQQHAELNDKYLRLAADYQNFQRRSQQNVAQAREQQAMSMARDLLTVLDHFDNALQVDPEKTTTQDLLKGVTIVRDELLRTLAGHGIERLDAEPGEDFDPNRHEALMHQPSEEHGSGRVAQQLQPGYVMRGKTLRPVKVAVVE